LKIVRTIVEVVFIALAFLAGTGVYALIVGLRVLTMVPVVTGNWL